MKQKGFYLFILLLSPSLLLSGEREIQQELLRVTTALEDIHYEINHNKAEIDLCHERVKTLEEQLQKQREIAPKKSTESTKLRLLEEGQKTLLADLKTLQGELNQWATRHNELEKNVQKQMKDVQHNLEKVVALLGGERVYTVKNGDSLGVIAKEQKVSLKVLRELNQLSGDQIYVGQKLKLPS